MIGPEVEHPHGGQSQHQLQFKICTAIRQVCNLTVFLQRYDVLQTVGEGTYGLVLRCVHKSTGVHVAIKKFKEARDEERVSLT